ncbi:MAG: ABC transporter ATP-binding protein [Deltaproteobacteria bacterium]|nr:ABC transporter ATP-binding protein [Deltaproteobacteria bacterium]
MLKVDGIETCYGPIAAVKGVSFEVDGGDIVTILGANGAGKSTIMRTISGLTPPARGRIEFLDRRIDRTPPEAIVRMGISHVPEGREIFPELTVRENLRVGAFTRRDTREVVRDMEGVYEYFPVLKERADQLGGTLSGGEQQMLAIGRALMSRPKMLLLDEPSMGLAPLIVDEIFRIIRAIHDSGTSILLVEQNAVMALEVANKAHVLETGRIVVSGSAKELLENPEVSRAYLGM